MYLEKEIKNANVLMTVKTYPGPTLSHKEVVCTAGLLDGKKWVRIYPINFRDKPYYQQFTRYSWIQLNLIKNPSDKRLESYQPEKQFDEEIKILDHIGTTNDWEERRNIICNGEVYYSMEEVINLAKEQNRSLVTLKPREIIDFIIEEDDRDWSPAQQRILHQESIFDYLSGEEKEIIKKIPYKYSYKFLTNGDTNPRTLMITDWEIGALYWNGLKKYQSEEITNQKIKEKFLGNFVNNCDLYFFLGTTYRHHYVSRNPYIIIGVFYPPKEYQPKLL